MDNTLEITFPVFRNNNMNTEYLFINHVFNSRKWKHSTIETLYLNGMKRAKFTIHESELLQFKEMVKACHPWFPMEYEPYYEYAMTEEQETGLFTMVEDIIEYVNETIGAIK